MLAPANVVVRATRNERPGPSPAIEASLDLDRRDLSVRVRQKQYQRG